MAAGARLLTATPADASEDPVAVRHAYSEKVAGTYEFKFGKDKPFLPSNATYRQR